VVKKMVGETFVEAACPYCSAAEGVAGEKCPSCHGAKVKYDEQKKSHYICKECKVKPGKRILLEE
jgi:DnaJ-class molecular chaperone